MAGYSPVLIQISGVRNFFTPSITTSDVTDNELRLKIEATETFIKDVYFHGSMPTAAIGKIPALLLTAAKVIQSPQVAKKYMVIKKESFDEGYSYELWGGGQAQKSPMTVALSWEEMAYKILEKRTKETTWGWKKIRLVND